MTLCCPHVETYFEQHLSHGCIQASRIDGNKLETLLEILQDGEYQMSRYKSPSMTSFKDLIMQNYTRIDVIHSLQTQISKRNLQTQISERNFEQFEVVIPQVTTNQRSDYPTNSVGTEHVHRNVQKPYLQNTEHRIDDFVQLYSSMTFALLGRTAKTVFFPQLSRVIVSISEGQQCHYFFLNIQA